MEDNPGDVRLTQEALKEAQGPSTTSAWSATAWRPWPSCGARGVRRRPRPDLILLDLNLPRKDGREVLAEIKADPDLRRIPVVILTTSKAEEDILKSYDLHANCYITKPVDLEQFESLVQSVNDFWLTMVKLPQKRVDE